MEQNSTREEFVKAIPGTMRTSDVFFAKKRLIAGGNFSVDWVPGSGTVVRVNGQVRNDPVAEPEFYDALLGAVAPRTELIR